MTILTSHTQAQPERVLEMEKNKAVSFKPVSPKRNSEDIASQIEESIIAGSYKPNDRLPSERELALQFNAGRAAVREALRILEGSGFIRVKSGGDGGIFVKKLDSSRMTKTILDLVRIGNINIREITQARIAIETNILESCINSLKEKEIQALEQNIKKCEGLIESEQSTEGEVQNFHILLASFSKNHLFEYFLISLVDISDFHIKKNFPGLQLSPTHLEHHKAILKAIKNKDPKEAKKALIIHLNSVEKELNEYFSRKHEQS